MQVTKILLDVFIFLKSMHINQATNTLLQYHNQLQNKNIHINVFSFSLWQMQ